MSARTHSFDESATRFHFPVGGRLKTVKMEWLGKTLELEDSLSVPAGDYLIGVEVESGLIRLVNIESGKCIEGKVKRGE